MKFIKWQMWVVSAIIIVSIGYCSEKSKAEERITDFNEGCYKIFLMPWLLQSDHDLCQEDERSAFAGGTGIGGERRLNYAACYKKIDNTIYLRWSNGVPMHLKKKILIRPYPTEITGGPPPKSCKFPKDDYFYIIH